MARCEHECPARLLAFIIFHAVVATGWSETFSIVGPWVVAAIQAVGKTAWSTWPSVAAFTPQAPQLCATP